LRKKILVDKIATVLEQVIRRIRLWEPSLSFSTTKRSVVGSCQRVSSISPTCMGRRDERHRNHTQHYFDQ